MEEPKEIALEGGPCSGKTTALAAIAARCQELGYTPIIFPEAATQLILSGIDPTRPEFQEYVLRDMLHNKRVRTDAVTAAGIEKPVFIYDRGMNGGKAYVSGEVFASTLARLGLSEIETRDIYDGVVFLETAAKGALKHYTRGNNEARRETPEEAIAINDRTHAAYIGTPHLITIPNRSGETFEMKIHECLEALARILGVPQPLEKERTFLLHEFTAQRMPAGAVPIDIVQTYLLSSNTDEVERVRARGQHDRYLYFHTMKNFYAPGEAVEIDRMIKQGMYTDLLIRRDPQRLSIHKTRNCFVQHDRYYELDVFHGHRSGLTLLEIEVADMDEEVFIPPELGTYTEVTEDPSYGNANLAKAA